MSINKKVLCLLSVFTLYISCSENEDTLAPEENTVENYRAVFSDWSEFEDTIQDLESSNSNDYIMNWIFEEGHSSLYIQDIEGEEELAKLENLTTGLIAILNKDYTFEVGGKVISFENNSFFSQAVGTEMLENSNIKEEIGKINIFYTDLDEKNPKTLNETARTGVYSNGGYAALQDKIFIKTRYEDCQTNYTSGSSTQQWKFRQQLKGVSIDIGAVYLNAVYVECKLYFNGRYAESDRNYIYNFSGTASQGNNFGSFNFNNVPRSCVGGSSSTARWNRFLIWQNNNYYLGNIYVTATGTITHELNGNGSSGRWVNSINW